MKKITFGAALLLTGLLFTTCSTDIDLLDDYKETTVVFGLLDQSQPKQYIRIQKAYLGEGNALTMAQISDSINYVNSLNVRIEEWNNGNLVHSYPLQPDTITNKDPGIFAYPNMVLYSTTGINPGSYNASSTYKLFVHNASGTDVTASSALVGNFSISSPTGTSITIAKIVPSYKITIKWSGATNGRVYQPALRFTYSETDINNVTTQKLIEIPLESSKATRLDGTETFDLAYDPTEFYRYLNNNMTVDGTIAYRTAGNLSVVVYAGGDDLNTYIDVNAPSTSVAQERPVFTNVTNGIGLFSARTNIVRGPYTLSNTTLDTLAYNHYTCHLRFKDKNGTVGFCQ